MTENDKTQDTKNEANDDIDTELISVGEELLLPRDALLSAGIHIGT